jgi:hypothetical protein
MASLPPARMLLAKRFPARPRIASEPPWWIARILHTDPIIVLMREIRQEKIHSVSCRGVRSRATLGAMRSPAADHAACGTGRRLDPLHCMHRAFQADEGSAFATAIGPGGESDGSNNATQLVIDVIDQNDY